jgi:pimeloyl-ACP methyl ester carboxylesterase
MKLAFKKLGSGRPMIILHGLFGSSDNWQTFGKKIADDFEVYLVDQRNHGRSPHSQEMSYDLMAEDLSKLFQDENIEEAIVLGHSMGGKTAMRFAQLFPEKVEQLVVADMGIKSYSPHHEEILDAIKAIDLEKLDSRGDADMAMMKMVPEFGVRQFILKNLYRKDKNTFGWRLNYRVLDAKMDAIVAALPKEKAEVPTLFIRGGESDYILESDEASIKKVFPRAEFATLPVGHWVHAADPEGFYKLLINFVTR